MELVFGSWIEVWMHRSRGWWDLLMGPSVHGILFDLRFLSDLSVSGNVHRSGALQRPRRLRASLWKMDLVCFEGDQDRWQTSFAWQKLWQDSRPMPRLAPSVIIGFFARQRIDQRLTDCDYRSRGHLDRYQALIFRKMRSGHERMRTKESGGWMGICPL